MHHRLCDSCGCSFAVSGLLAAPAARTNPPHNHHRPDPRLRRLRFQREKSCCSAAALEYFEHFGSVKGDATAELRFKTDQINDVLKSLLLQDMDGGMIGTVSYPSRRRWLPSSSFQVDIT